MHTTHKKIAIHIVTILQQQGFIALFAGGCVRDQLLGITSDDIDIATNAHPKQVMKLFSRAITVGSQFGVVRVIVQNHEFEIATFRSDEQYINGRKPHTYTLVQSPEQDALRRDFTINGMMYDPITQTLYDYVHGQQDLKKKYIRTIGDANQRFTEDRLRIIRAIRFKNKFCFVIEKHTWQAICAHAQYVTLSVSPERIWQELQKMTQQAILGPCLFDMLHCSLLYYLFPQLENISKQEIQKRINQIHTYTGTCLPAALCLLVLQHRDRIAHTYHLSRHEQTIFSTFSQLETFPLQNVSDILYVYLYALPEIEPCIHAFACTKKAPEQYIQQHMKRKQKLAFWIKQVQTNSFFISGKDLQKLGVPAGKKMGKLIKQAFELSITYKLHDKQQILAMLGI